MITNRLGSSESMSTVKHTRMTLALKLKIKELITGIKKKKENKVMLLSVCLNCV